VVTAGWKKKMHKFGEEKNTDGRGKERKSQRSFLCLTERKLEKKQRAKKRLDKGKKQGKIKYCGYPIFQG